MRLFYNSTTTFVRSRPLFLVGPSAPRSGSPMRTMAIRTLVVCGVTITTSSTQCVPEVLLQNVSQRSTCMAPVLLQNESYWNVNKSYAVSGGNPLPCLPPLVTVSHLHLTSLDNLELGPGTILGLVGHRVFLNRAHFGFFIVLR